MWSVLGRYAVGKGGQYAVAVWSVNQVNLRYHYHRTKDEHEDQH